MGMREGTEKIRLYGRLNNPLKGLDEVTNEMFGCLLWLIGSM